MDETTLQLLTWFLAFWTALLGFAARQSRIQFPERFVLGLALGAVLAHLGWALLHFPVVRTQPMVFTSPAVGYTVLLLPLGLLATAPWSARPAQRSAWLAAAFGALPAALAVARAGCWIAHCCRGVPTSLPWGVTPGGVGVPEHPVALYEIAGLLLLRYGAGRAPAAWVPAVVLMGFGGLRLLLEPLRAQPPLGAPLLAPALLAALWLPVGLALSPLAARLRLVPNGPGWPQLAGRAGRRSR